MAGKDAQVLGLHCSQKLPFPLHKLSVMAGAAADEGLAGGAGIEVTACGFSSTALPCGVRSGAHLGPEPPVIQDCCCLSRAVPGIIGYSGTAMTTAALRFPASAICLRAALPGS